MRRSRKSAIAAIAALALAAGTSLFVWRGTGPEMQAANASTNDAAALAPVKATPAEPVVRPAPAAVAPTAVVHAHNAIRVAAPGRPGPAIASESEACKLLEGDPTQITPAIEGLLGAVPKASPSLPAGDLGATAEIQP
jgi:hypothetical protein